LLVKIGKFNGNRNSGNSYTRVILTEIYHLSGMNSFRDDLIDRMKTGWGRFVLASNSSGPVDADPRSKKLLILKKKVKNYHAF
jgi:hypothetical protein